VRTEDKKSVIEVHQMVILLYPFQGKRTREGLLLILMVSDFDSRGMTPER